MKSSFMQGNRYDIKGIYPAFNQVDPETLISRELTDEEILRVGAMRQDATDRDGQYMLRRLRANQTLFMLARGAYLMGYTRGDFDPATYCNRGQDPKQMHSSYHSILNRLIPVLTGYRMYSLVSPAARRSDNVFIIDPVGVISVADTKIITATAIAMLVDNDITLPQKFINKLSASRAEQEEYPQARRGQSSALRHITPGEYLPPGQTSIMDRPMNEEERAELGRPSAREDRQRSNADKGKAKGKRQSSSDREHARKQAQRWDYHNR
jgi:hypothetical protein